MYKEYLLEVINKYPITNENISFSKIIKLREKIENMSEEESKSYIKTCIKEQLFSGQFPTSTVAAGIGVGNYVANTPAAQIGSDFAGFNTGVLAPTGAALTNAAGPMLFSLFRILKAQRDNCVRSCGEFSLFGGQKRNLCLAKCHYQVSVSEMQQIKSMMNNCKGNQICLQTMQQKYVEASSRMAKAQSTMIDLQMKLQRSGMSQKDLDRPVNPNSQHLFFNKKGDKK